MNINPSFIVASLRPVTVRDGTPVSCSSLGQITAMYTAEVYKYTAEDYGVVYFPTTMFIAFLFCF